jgi:hypothetical protein
MALKSVETQNVEFKSSWRDEYLKLNWGLACKHAHIYFWLYYTILPEGVIGILKRDLRGKIFRACSQKESALFV